MNKLIGIAMVAAALTGCKKDKATSSGDGAPERDGSALWKLAPEGTEAGLVIAAGAGAELHRGFIAVAESLKANPIGAEAVAEMLADARREGVDPMSADGFKSIGIDPALPLAVFVIGEKAYGVVPVSDRAAFNKQVGGTTDENGVDIVEGESACKMVEDTYRCANSAEALAAWKPAAKPIDAGWSTELRGSIEFFVAGKLLEEAEPISETMDSASALRGAVRIERGAFLLRYHVSGKVKKPFAAAGETPLADAVKKSNPAALLTAYAPALIDVMREGAGAKLDKPGPNGITPAKLFDSLTGELVAFAPAGGEPRGFVEIGIRDPAPFRELAPLCAMAPPLAAGVTIKSTNNGCAASFGPPATPMPFEIAVDVTDKSIVAAIGEATAGRQGDGPALPAYYQSERWLGSMWLRGSILGGADALQVPQVSEALQQIPEIGLGLWGYAHLSELGAGLRTDDNGAHGFVRVATTWRNPPAVVAGLEPLIARFAKGDFAVTADIKKLAAEHADSPLAGDLALGSSGGAAGAASLGVLSAVAIPAFIKYQKRAAEAGGELAVMKFEQLKEAMCQCKDPECAKQVAASFEQLSREALNAQLSAGSMEKMAEISEKYTACMARAFGAQ